MVHCTVTGCIEIFAPHTCLRLTNLDIVCVVHFLIVLFYDNDSQQFTTSFLRREIYDQRWYGSEGVFYRNLEQCWFYVGLGSFSLQNLKILKAHQLGIIITWSGIKFNPCHGKRVRVVYKENSSPTTKWIRIGVVHDRTLFLCRPCHPLCIACAGDVSPELSSMSELVLMED
jgi:hypothetical protein